MILDWNKPKQAMPTDEWKAISADCAPPGVYVPNMSQADKEKWKAKVVGKRSRPQVEIRRTFNGTQALIIVSNGGFIGKPRSEKFCIHISANGPMWLDGTDWDSLHQAVSEAKNRLMEITSDC